MNIGNLVIELNNNKIMKRGLIYRLNHDVRNIIETMDFQYRMKNTNNEYRQVFHFFDVLYYVNKCPNSHGRCVTKYIDVTIHWLDRKLHRKNGPAIEWSNGTKEWYFNNQRHRDSKKGPAIEWSNGTKEWYVNGKCHREDGPAVEFASGDKYWYYKNQLHREDGPAIEYAHSYKAWFYKGRQHRNSNDGPAVEFAIDDRPNEYWEFGKRVK